MSDEQKRRFKEFILKIKHNHILMIIVICFASVFTAALVYGAMTLSDTVITSDGSLILSPVSNVGIGTASPAYKLDVAGDVNVTGNFKINGTSVAAGSTATNVLNYGAVGNGTTDDTLAIRAAITAAGVDGTLLFPPGKTFIVSGNFRPLAGQTWWGYGAALKRANQISTTTSTPIVAAPGVTTITVASAAGFYVGQDVTVFNGSSYDTHNHNIFSIVGNVISLGTDFTQAFPSGGTLVSSTYIIFTNAAKVSILGLEFNGNRANNTLLNHWDNHWEIWVDGDRSTIRDVYIHDAQAEGIIASGVGTSVEHSWIIDSVGNGIHGSGSTDLRVVGNYVKNCNLGGVAVGHADGCIIFSDSTGDSLIQDNYIDNGISCVGSIDYEANSSVIITGNICHNATLAAVEMILPDVSAGKVIIANNFFYDSAPLTLNNTASPPAANTGPYRVSIADNYFENTRILVQRGLDISITGNTLVGLTDTTNVGIYTYYCRRCVIASNLIRGFAYAIYVDGTAGQIPESININGNTMHNQYSGGVRTNIASTIGVVIQANTIQTDAGYASASYGGIIIANGASVLNNVMDLQSGQYGVLCPNGGASTQGAIVSGNVIRGALTASIRTNGGSQKNIIINNFVQQAVQDGGTPNNTVTGNITIL